MKPLRIFFICLVIGIGQVSGGHAGGIEIGESWHQDKTFEARRETDVLRMDDRDLEQKLDNRIVQFVEAYPHNYFCCTRPGSKYLRFCLLRCDDVSRWIWPYGGRGTKAWLRNWEGPLLPMSPRYEGSGVFAL